MRSLLRVAVMAVASVGAMTAAAKATTLEISVTHNGNTPLFITPLYTAFHNGSFDAFDAGEAASPGLELLAETGNFMGPGSIAEERSGAFPDSQGVGVLGAAGPGPIFPPGLGPAGADVGSAIIDIMDPTQNRFFTFLAMILPSNDTFIGNDNAMAYEIFDQFGNFNGPLDIEITGANIYDAGTEANDPSADGGAAFVLGADIGAGGPGEGLIQQGLDLNAFAGVGLAPPPDPNNQIGTLDGFIDFTSDPGAFNLLTVSIREVQPIPLPASGLLLLGGLAGMGLLRRRRKT